MTDSTPPPSKEDNPNEVPPTALVPGVVTSMRKPRALFGKTSCFDSPDDKPSPVIDPSKSVFKRRTRDPKTGDDTVFQTVSSPNTAMKAKREDAQQLLTSKREEGQQLLTSKRQEAAQEFEKEEQQFAHKLQLGIVQELNKIDEHAMLLFDKGVFGKDFQKCYDHAKKSALDKSEMMSVAMNASSEAHKSFQDMMVQQMKVRQGLLQQQMDGDITLAQRQAIININENTIPDGSPVAKMPAAKTPAVEGDAKMPAVVEESPAKKPAAAKMPAVGSDSKMSTDAKIPAVAAASESDTNCAQTLLSMFGDKATISGPPGRESQCAPNFIDYDNMPSSGANLAVAAPKESFSSFSYGNNENVVSNVASAGVLESADQVAGNIPMPAFGQVGDGIPLDVGGTKVATAKKKFRHRGYFSKEGYIWASPFGHPSGELVTDNLEYECDSKCSFVAVKGSVKNDKHGFITSQVYQCGCFLSDTQQLRPRARMGLTHYDKVRPRGDGNVKWQFQTNSHFDNSHHSVLDENGNETVGKPVELKKELQTRN
ncbi:MAG: hypothetical protein SGILL_001535 [Bacillariaceae sp.]